MTITHIDENEKITPFVMSLRRIPRHVSAIIHLLWRNFTLSYSCLLFVCVHFPFPHSNCFRQFLKSHSSWRIFHLTKCNSCIDRYPIRTFQMKYKKIRKKTFWTKLSKKKFLSWICSLISFPQISYHLETFTFSGVFCSLEYIKRNWFESNSFECS